MLRKKKGFKVAQLRTFFSLTFGVFRQDTEDKLTANGAPLRFGSTAPKEAQ